MNNYVAVLENHIQPDVFRIIFALDGHHMSVVNVVVQVHVLREESGHGVFMGCLENPPTVVAFEAADFEGHFCCRQSLG